MQLCLRNLPELTDNRGTTGNTNDGRQVQAEIKQAFNLDKRVKIWVP